MSERSKYIQHGWNSQEPITVAKMNNIESIVPSVIAPEYSTELNYAPGDYITCRGVLYKCKNNTTGDFKQSDWDEAWIAGKSEFEGQDEGWPNLATDLLNKITEEGLKQAASSAAYLSDTYTKKKYSVGSFCIKDNELYRCVVKIDSAEDWNSDHWEKVQIGNILYPIQYSICYRGTLGSSDDINSLETGIYRKNTDNTPINWPETFPDGLSSTYGILIALKINDEYRVLIYFPGRNTNSNFLNLRKNNSCFLKFRANATWGEWISFKVGTGVSNFNINQSAIGPEFNPDKGYEEGDYIFYNGDLYKFRKAHSGEWDTDDVENKTSINKELKTLYNNLNASLANAISIVNSSINDLNITDDGYSGASEFNLGNKWLKFKKGYYSTPGNGTPGEYNDNDLYVTAFCPCQKDDIFTVNVYAFAGGSRSWAIYDSSMNVLDRATTHEHTERVITVTQDNAAYIAFNNGLSRIPEGYYAIKGDTSNIRSNIEQIIDSIGYNYERLLITSEIGYRWDSQSYNNIATKVEKSNYRAYNPIPVNPGETYKVYGYDAANSNTRLALITDIDYNILKKYGAYSRAIQTYEFTIPQDGAYIILSTDQGHTIQCYKKVLNKVNSNIYAGMFKYNDKNVAIIGDSVQTNGNWSTTNPFGNVPEIIVYEEDVGVENFSLSAYVTFYDIGTVLHGQVTIDGVTTLGHEIVAADVGKEINFIPTEEDIGTVIGKPLNNNGSEHKPVWWMIAAEYFEFNPIPVCWSGSSITDHEEFVTQSDSQEPGEQSTGYPYKCAHAFHDSQIRKCGIRIPGTMDRIAPDMIIIARGGNDLTHINENQNAYPAKITNYMDSFPVQYPTTDTYEENGKTFRDFAKGLRMTIKKCRDAYPEAKIVLCTLSWFRRWDTSSPFTKVSFLGYSTSWNEYNDTIRKVAAHEGCDLIEFDKCGLTWSNAPNQYYKETNGKYTHPVAKGHKVLANRAIRDLTNINSME